MDLYLQTELGYFLEANHTCPELAFILLDALHCEVHGCHPAFQRRHGVYDDQFSAALLQAQTNLGWSQLLQGRLAKDWSRLQDNFREENKRELEIDPRYYTGDIWARKLVSHLWGAIKVQWDLWNGVRHGHTKEANHVIRHARLLTAITDMYNDAPRMIAADRAIILPTSPPLHDKRHPTGLELWLKRTRAIVTRITLDATTTIQRTHERLHHFFRHRRLK
jgi:hypothetical protein